MPLRKLSIILNSSTLNINFNINFNERIDKNIELTFYRVFQELLTNTTKHANASIVNLTISKTQNQLIFEYQDNGVGLKSNKIDQFGIGVNNIKNRVYALNGTIKINSSKGNGYQTTIIIPNT